jgi:transcriptional regulator with XRE-family HTH domain
MIASRLRELRMKQGLSQEELAKILNIARTTYSGYEKGDREPDFELLIKIANYYDVSLDYLFARDYQRSELAALIAKMPQHKAEALEVFVRVMLND